jgi:hypothetical protein
MTTEPTWTRSTLCDSGGCLEIAFWPDGSAWIRSSNDEEAQ